MLDAAKARGVLICGVIGGQPGLATLDDENRWQGFDVEFCRAFGAAVLGDAEAIELAAFEPPEARKALANGAIDVLARDIVAFGLDDSAALRFTTHSLVNAQGFLVPVKDGPLNTLDLNGARVCVRAGSAAEANLANHARAAGVNLEPVVLPTLENLGAALTAGRCRAVTAGRLELATLRAKLSGDAGAFAILPELLSREQMGPFVRDGDPGWFNLVKWTVFALIQAEESGVTQASVESLRATSRDPRIQRFLGVTGGLGGALGVADDWVVRIVGAVGNYAEIYDRHLGPGSPLGLERGPNALWSDGGMLHAMPFQ